MVSLVSALPLSPFLGLHLYSTNFFLWGPIISFAHTRWSILAPHACLLETILSSETLFLSTGVHTCISQCF